MTLRHSARSYTTTCIDMVSCVDISHDVFLTLNRQTLLARSQDLDHAATLSSDGFAQALCPGILFLHHQVSIAHSCGKSRLISIQVPHLSPASSHFNPGITCAICARAHATRCSDSCHSQNRSGIRTPWCRFRSYCRWYQLYQRGVQETTLVYGGGPAQ